MTCMLNYLDFLRCVLSFCVRQFRTERHSIIVFHLLLTQPSDYPSAAHV